jgi:hypothetical protein
VTALERRVEAVVHAARPEMRKTPGDVLLAQLMLRIAWDDAQQWNPHRLPGEDHRNPERSVPPDPGSLKAQRFLLRMLYP